MRKTKNVKYGNELSLEDYKKLVEVLRIRINVLNASVFLLEEKINIKDSGTSNYLEKINNELEIIRKLILPYPTQVHH